MARRKRYTATAELKELMARCADGTREDRQKAMDEFCGYAQEAINVRLGFAEKEEKEASALSVTPDMEIQEAVMPGDIYSGIFETAVLGWDQQPMYPMGVVSPGEEGDYAAYTVPNNGYLPQRLVEGDEVTIPTYRVGNAIDWSRDYMRKARVDVVSQCMETLGNGFVQKFNDDAWHTILAAGYNRGIMVYDSGATQGVLTKKLIQLMKVSMLRNGGGNAASMNPFTLTDLYISPEAMEDINSWTGTELSEISRTELERDANGLVKRIMGVNLHVLTELGESQKYNNYYTSTLSGSLAVSDVELVVGLDLSKRNTFVMPVRGNGIEVESDTTTTRSNLLGVFSSVTCGFAVLDSRAVLLSSI